MPTDPEIHDFLLDQLSREISLESRRMFGEYCLYSQQKVIAFLCDNQLFVKITPDLREKFPELPLGHPYPNAKPHFQISPDLWENRTWLAQFLLATTAALPTPKPKKSKKSSP